MEDQTIHWSNSTHKNWWIDPGLRKNTAWIILLYCGSFVIGYDGSLLNGFQAMPQWNQAFDSPSGTRLGIITASLYIAQLLSSPFIPWICDTYGRRAAIFWGSIGIIVGAVLICFSRTERMFIFGRVVIGLFCDFPIIGAACLVNELAHPRLRGISSGLYMVIYNVGALVAAWFTFACLSWKSNWSWRLPALLQSFGPVVLIFVALFGPESPRYLISKGRNEEALGILARYHANGQHDDQLVQQEFEEISSQLGREKATLVGSWRSLVATPGNRRRMLIVCIVTSGVIVTGTGPVSFYFAPILRSVGISNPTYILIINGGLAIFNTFMAVIGGLCVDRVGRRSLFVLSTTGMLLTYIVIIGLSATFARTPTPSFGIAFVVMFFLCFGSYDIAWLPLCQLYPAEILPFSIRAKAISVGNFVTALCLSISNFVNPIGLEMLQWRFYFVFLAVQVVYLACIWLFVIETRGRTLEQVSILFDDDQLVHPNRMELCNN
ncbi:hypothetical protein GYMLUDRAFT_995129 [Collybiopsis luxurians FD-317 M1]|uniref:Major facilitator superfamily (MFS) profile domain-containing protein n=1 Tax=Collybiopsis luxurians FD-317 M1 TaxID=944289 RepID=A0A0D0CHZ7_9AGAR|nr:hypothetical protein GYMLUDRAFT_995129 [Collybiopsis luxurians FD-317 M1]